MWKNGGSYNMKMYLTGSSKEKKLVSQLSN